MRVAISTWAASTKTEVPKEPRAETETHSREQGAGRHCTTEQRGGESSNWEEEVQASQGRSNLNEPPPPISVSLLILFFFFLLTTCGRSPGQGPNPSHSSSDPSHQIFNGLRHKRTLPFSSLIPGHLEKHNIGKGMGPTFWQVITIDLLLREISNLTQNPQVWRVWDPPMGNL